MKRVWIYQADRFLSETEANQAKDVLDEFVSSWTAHGSALAGTAKVVENIFVVLEVDEEHAGVTGCSIDKSVHFIKGLGQQLGVDFFDRMRIAFRDEAGKVILVSRNDFELLIAKAVVTPDTIVFNNLVQNSAELKTKWEIPFKESWHSKVFS